MIRRVVAYAVFSAVLAVGTAACDSVAPSSEGQGAQSSDSTQGQLALYANGEDFIRAGFLSKDGWAMQFDHVYVTLADVTAYQSDPPFNPDTDDRPQAQITAQMPDPVTVDLAAGDESAEPILVAQFPAAPGQYNALAWEMTPALNDPHAGYSLVLQGTAQKDSQAIPFLLQLKPQLSFLCGDYVGDERKGILAATGQADLEATFHFDHLFGDGNSDAEDAINQEALGFEPLAALAQDGRLEVTSADLQSQLSASDYKTLSNMLDSLGHVGEGHCQQVA